MNLEEPGIEPPVSLPPGRSVLRCISVQTRYRLVRRLGAGGMATVHLAAIEREEGFSRNVALKIVREDYAHFPELAKLFAVEASLAAKLTHPNIVSIFDYCRDENSRPFLVMEVVNGISLRALIHQKPAMPLPAVAFVMAEVLRGLGYAHQLPRGTGIRGLLHRDISPHNILLSWEGAVKISDFGIAKALMTTSGMITGSEAIGKPAYMSPEQVSHDSMDRRSDLFSLGVVFWEMLAGARLFRGALPSEVFKEIATSPILPPSHHRPVPRDLERIAMKLLKRERERRYACAEDVLADLMKCREMTSNGAGELVALLSERFPPHARRGADEAGQESTESATVDGHPDRETRMSVGVPPRPLARRWMMAAVLAGLVVAGAGAMQLWGDSSGTRTQGTPANKPAGASAPTSVAAPAPPGPAASLPPAAPLPPPATSDASSAAAAASPVQASRDARSKKPERASPKAAEPASLALPSGILNVRFDGSSPTGP